MVEAVVIGVGVVVAAAVARIAVASRRGGRRRRERIDPFTVGEPWRHFVQDALSAERRFDDTVKAMQPGPLRDRLTDLGGRISDGVQTCWRIASQGASLQKGLQQFDVKAIERGLANNDTPKPARDALVAQQASFERVQNVWQEARDKLRVLNAQLDEAVARAVELSLSSADPSDARLLAGDVDSLLDDLESLRRAVDEVEGAGGTTTP